MTKVLSKLTGAASKLSRQKGRRYLKAGGIALCLLGALFAFEAHRIATPVLLSAGGKVLYIIVLGGGTKHSGELGASAKERARAAAFYMTDNPGCKVVVSGGRGRYGGETEAALLKNYMLSLYILNDPASGGSPADFAWRILEEDRSRNTIENLRYSAEVIAQDSGVAAAQALHQSIAIATSGYHLSRAEHIARALGYTNVSGIAALTPPLAVPRAYLREILAWIKLDLTMFFKEHGGKIASKQLQKIGDSTRLPDESGKGL